MYNGVNASFIADRLGNINSAVYLNNGYYRAPPDVYFSGDHTVALWISVKQISNSIRIIDFGNGNKSDNVYLYASYNATISGPFSLIFNMDQSQPRVFSNTALQLNVWTHLASTYSNGTCKIYVDGNLTGAGNCQVPRAVNRSKSYVGTSENQNRYLNAEIDELRIYNRSLNETELNQMIASSSLNYMACSTTNTSSTTQSTTLMTTNTTSTAHISIINSTFEFARLSSSQIFDLLNSSYDLSGCIVNCSKKGLCKFDSIKNKFICSCFSAFISGYACQIDTRPCSNNPCLNNATCVDDSNSNSYSFKCLCNEFYYGNFCESKIDVCQNETCSSNGNCFDSNNSPECKCFSMYSGDNCESESNELKTIKTIISITVIIAIIIIISFYIIIALMDLTRYLCNKKSFIPVRGKKKSKKKQKKSNKKANKTKIQRKK